MDELLIHNAEEKLKRESEGITDSRQRIMLSSVREALTSFCKQEREFAQAIIESKQTFKDCMAAVAKNVGSSISDLEAYRRAAQFYFPGAGIKFSMEIDLCGPVKDGGKDALSISLTDLL